MNISLENKIAVVCGSTQGIGLEAAKVFAENGAKLLLIARNEEKLKKVISELPNAEKHDYLTADFTQPEVLREKITAWSENNNAHILLNNTGGPKGGPIIDADTSEFTEAFTQHLICNHILVQALWKGMKSEGYGRIINVISTSVKQPLDGLGVSNTVRGAVANWSKTMANELGKHNITVNNVLPGATNTVRLKDIAENKVKKNSDLTVDKVFEGMAQASPMKRIAEPNEVANAIAFLASPAASYINGINVPVDGGRTKSL